METTFSMEQAVMNPPAEAGGLALGVRRSGASCPFQGTRPEPSAVRCRVYAGVPGGLTRHDVREACASRSGRGGLVRRTTHGDRNRAHRGPTQSAPRSGSEPRCPAHRVSSMQR